MKSTINIAPTTHALDAQHNTLLGWDRAIGELVDNSFDADAHRIVISIDRKLLEVSDDGCGTDDIQAMFQQGRHVRHGSTQLGRYGVGLKDAAIWMWGTTSVFSATSKNFSRGTVDWDAIKRSGAWDVDVDRFDVTLDNLRDAKILSGQGTRLLFERIGRTFTKTNLDKLLDYLSYTFSPAIESGKQIEIKFSGKSYLVPVYKRPSLDQPLETSGIVAGHSYRVRAGIVRKGEANNLRGFAIAFRHRVMDPTQRGCGEFSPSRFWGWVELGDGWKLSRNKDRLAEHFDELAADLLQKCRSILQQAHTQGQTLEVNSLKGRLEQQIGDLLSDLRHAKREKKDATGTVTPTGDGAKHQRATLRHIFEGKYGPKNPPKNLGGCLVEFDDLGADQVIGLAEAADGNKVRVTLNKQHPWVVQLMPYQEGPGIIQLVLSLLADYLIRVDPKQLRQLMIRFPEAESEQGRYVSLLSCLLQSRRCEAEQKLVPEAA
jgi:hypothetical protein